MHMFLSVAQRVRGGKEHMYRKQLLTRYFAEWVNTYKRGAVTDITLSKYLMTLRHLEELAPEVILGDLSRMGYQRILNDFAKNHERQTVMNFHHQVKAAIMDAVDEGVLRRDPTRKAVVKGNQPRDKRPKYLNQFELRTMLAALQLDDDHLNDYLLLLVAKTGLRFGEALGLTPGDIDFQMQQINVEKTWNYKDPKGGFAPTKNRSSQRKVRMDWSLCMHLKHLCDGRDPSKPLFVTEGKRIFNATVNDRLAAICKQCNIPAITVHGLRHTHASLLLYAGVSVASVAKRLGHANMTTTQMTYLHIIKELEAKDTDKVMQFLSTL